MKFVFNTIKFLLTLVIVYVLVFASFLLFMPIGMASASGDYFGFDSYNTGNLNGQDSWYSYPPIPTLDSQQINTTQYQSSANSSRGGMASGYAWSGHHFTAPLSAFSFYWRGVNNTNLGDVEFASDFSTRANSVRLYKTNNDLNCILRENGTNKSAVLIDTSFFDSTFKQITMSMTGYQIYINGVSCGTFSSSSYWNTIDEIGLYYPGTGTDQYYIDTISINGGSPLPPAPTVPAQSWNAEGHEAIFNVTCNATGELWYDFTGTFTKYADCTSGVATEVYLYKETLSETPVTVNFQTRNGNGNSASSPYSVTFAPYTPPTVPADFNTIPYTVEFDVTCTQNMDLTYLIETEMGAVDDILMSYRALKEDCEVDEVVPVSVIVPDAGTYNFYFQHVGGVGISSEYSVVVVTVGFEFTTYDVPVLLYGVDNSVFTTSDITVYFETQLSGLIECVNDDTGQSFKSYNYAIDLLHVQDLEITLQPNTNNFTCRQRGQWGESGALTFSVEYLVTGLPILPSSPWTNKTNYRLVVNISENLVDDLLCRAGDDTFAIITDSLSTEKKYYDIDLTGYAGFDLTTGFELPIDCYFDDGVGTEVRTILAFRPLVPSSSDNVICYSSENQDNPDDDSKWEVLYWYHRVESMFMKVPVIGDIGEINCYLYNHILMPVAEYAGGPPLSSFGASTTEQIGDIITISPFELDLQGNFDQLESDGLLSRDGTNDSANTTEMKGIMTAFLWLLWVGLIYLLFHKTDSNG